MEKRINHYLVWHENDGSMPDSLQFIPYDKVKTNRFGTQSIIATKHKIDFGVCISPITISYADYLMKEWQLEHSWY